jgi:hypothetical protein
MILSVTRGHSCQWSGGRSGCPLCVTLSKEREETQDKPRLSLLATEVCNMGTSNFNSRPTSPNSPQAHYQNLKSPALVRILGQIQATSCHFISL